MLRLYSSCLVEKWRNLLGLIITKGTVSRLKMNVWIVLTKKKSEISRPIKFLLDRDAQITATLTSTSYYAFSLVQVGLEIPRLVEVFMPLTINNKEIISKYEELIDALYQEKDCWPVIGSILVFNQPHKPADVDHKGTKRKRSHATMNPSKKTQKDNYGKDI